MQAGSTIWWTWEVEDAFRNVRLGDKNAMKTFSIKLSNQLNDLVAMVRSDLSNLQRKKVIFLLWILLVPKCPIWSLGQNLDIPWYIPFSTLM